MKCLSAIVATLLLLFQAACDRGAPSYESQFRDIISIHYPPGHPYDKVDSLGADVDELLRGEKIGFWDGVMGAGDPMDIDHISLAMDFDLVDEKTFVQSLIDAGTIPKDVEVTYRPGKRNAENDQR